MSKQRHHWMTKMPSEMACMMDGDRTLVRFMSSDGTEAVLFQVPMGQGMAVRKMAEIFNEIQKGGKDA